MNYCINNLIIQDIIERPASNWEYTWAIILINSCNLMRYICTCKKRGKPSRRARQKLLCYAECMEDSGSWYQRLIMICIGGSLGFVALFTAPLTMLGAVLVEESLKWVGIRVAWTRQPSFEPGFMIGLGFAVTEGALYLTNAWVWGNGEIMWLRFMTTFPLHIVCAGLSARYRVGIVLAILIHALFNVLVTPNTVLMF